MAMSSVREDGVFQKAGSSRNQPKWYNVGYTVVESAGLTGVLEFRVASKVFGPSNSGRIKMLSPPENDVGRAGLGGRF